MLVLGAWFVHDKMPGESQGGQEPGRAAPRYQICNEMEKQSYQGSGHASHGAAMSF